MGALAAAMALLLLAVFGAHRPAMPQAVPPSAFPIERVAEGAALARIGNCASCHTAPGGRAFAGGVPLRTPFGTIYGSNITPDAETGIGRWSLAAFTRAMREGVARDGSHLYPAFPYDHFSRLTDDDVAALYAFLMTRDAVSAAPPRNRLIPPLGFRPVIAGWKLLFFHPAATAAPGDRGAYLAEGLAHCGACHSPRNALQAERRDRAYAGGWAEGWYAPPLDGSSPAVRAWTAQRLYTYLRTGLSPSHAAAAGPMGEVTYNLARAPEADVRAIAGYFAARMRQAPAGRVEPALADRAAEAARAHPQGAALFTGACAACHQPGAPMMVEGGPPLPLGSPLHESNPRDTIQIILKGLNPPTGSAGPYMPAFGDAFGDAQIAEIVAYLHARYGSAAQWQGIAKEVAKARKEGQP